MTPDIVRRGNNVIILTLVFLVLLGLLPLLFVIEINNASTSTQHLSVKRPLFSSLIDFTRGDSYNQPVRNPDLKIRENQSDSDPEIRGNHSASDPAFKLTLDPNKKIILLLSSFRTGSSFLGQLFDSNPDIQYLFEPFYDPAIRKMYRAGRFVFRYYILILVFGPLYEPDSSVLNTIYQYYYQGR